MCQPDDEMLAGKAWEAMQGTWNSERSTDNDSYREIKSVCLCEIHMVVLYLIYPFYPLFFRVVTRCLIFNTNLLQIGFNHFFKV